MAVDHIRYDLLTQDALRGVLRTVLADAAKNGLPGEHHFYISFETTAEGVRLSPRMLAQYPKEITIVLQHQFWDLEVKDESFEVGLSFGGIPERLVVPFAAIKGFFDPAVQFGLQFQEEASSANEEDEAPGQPVAVEQAAKEEQSQSPSALPLARRPANPQAGVPPPSPQAGVPPANPQAEIASKRGEPADSGAEVVRLDRFRKK
ncbi:MAG TPA: ClpXP protease specificity-enhancing factor SspB [Xanthobacteraceae bacterium]|jgi:hypothetical protein